MPDLTPPLPTVASAAASQAIPFRSDADAQAQGVGFPAAALACLVLLAVAIAILKRTGTNARWLRAGSRVLQVSESVRVADRTRVSVVRYRSREIVIAHSEGAITVLSDEPMPPGDDA